MDPVTIAAAVLELAPLAQQFTQGALSGQELVDAWNATVDRVKAANAAWEAAGKTAAP